MIKLGQEALKAAMTKGIYNEDHFAREALQARLIASIFARRIPGVVLKGGLAFRALMGSARLTKDVDLDSLPAFSYEVARHALRLAIKDCIKDSGLIENPVVTEPKQTSTTMRWKITGQVPGGSSNLHLTLEVSRRESIYADEQIAKKVDGWGSINVYSEKALCAMKAMALTEPHRSAPRDLFDLWTLVQMNVEPPIELLSKMGPERIQLAQTELWPKIESYSLERFLEEVGPFIPFEERIRMTESAWSSARLAVGEKLEEWFDQALLVAQKKKESEPVRPLSHHGLCARGVA